MKIFILCQKDLKILLKSSSLWILLGLSSILWGVLFFNYSFRYAELFNSPFQGEQLSTHWAIVSQHIFSNHFILLFFIPALTMRTLSEEKRMKTYELLLTSPISSLEIILSKFLTCLCVVLLFLLLSSIPFLWLHSVVPIEWGLFWSSFLGLFLISGLYISIGLFASSLTSSHLVSLITAILLNVFILMIGEFNYSVENAILSHFFQYISVEKYFVSFMKGAISTNALVFLLSAWCLLLFLSERIVESLRWR